MVVVCVFFMFLSSGICYDLSRSFLHVTALHIVDIFVLYLFIFLLFSLEQTELPQEDKAISAGG